PWRGRAGPLEALHARCDARVSTSCRVRAVSSTGRVARDGARRRRRRRRRSPPRRPAGAAAAGRAPTLESAAVDLYEYQGKELFGRFGIPVSEGRLATTPEEARRAAEELGGPVVVKAQVLTGGRGKAGGVKLAQDPGEAEARANDILGLDIRGHVVRRLWIEQASELAKEDYLSGPFHRRAKEPLFMFTTQGGVEIEEVAANDPDALVRLHIDPLEGFQPWV